MITNTFFGDFAFIINECIIDRHKHKFFISLLNSALSNPAKLDYRDSSTREELNRMYNASKLIYPAVRNYHENQAEDDVCKNICKSISDNCFNHLDINMLDQLFAEFLSYYTDLIDFFYDHSANSALMHALTQLRDYCDAYCSSFIDSNVRINANEKRECQAFLLASAFLLSVCLDSNRHSFRFPENEVANKWLSSSKQYQTSNIDIVAKLVGEHLSSEDINNELSDLQPIEKITRLTTSTQMIGREWIESKLTGQITAIIGGPGSGKSTLAANLAVSNDGILAAFSSNDNISLRDVIITIAYKLVEKNKDYADVLRAKFASASSEYNNYSPQKLVGFLFSDEQQAEGLWYSGYIILDALDECPDDDSQELIDTIILLSQSPVFSEAKFVLTTRPGTYIESSWTKIYLSGSKQRQDIVEYLYSSISEEKCEEAGLDYQNTVDSIVSLVQDNFLFAEGIVTDIADKTAEEIGSYVLPESFNQYNFQQFDRLFSPSRYHSVEVYKKAISIIYSAVEPLTEPVLFDMLPGLSDSDFFVRAKRILTISKYNREITFYHKSVYDFVGSEAAGIYRLTKKAGSQLLFDASFAQFEKYERISTKYNGVWPKTCIMPDHFIDHYETYGQTGGDRNIDCLEIMNSSKGFRLYKLRRLFSKTKFDEVIDSSLAYINENPNQYSDLDLEARIILLSTYLDRNAPGDYSHAIELYSELTDSSISGGSYVITNPDMRASLVIDNASWLFIKGQRYEDAIKTLESWISYNYKPIKLMENALNKDSLQSGYDWINQLPIKLADNSNRLLRSSSFQKAHTIYLLGMAYYYREYYINATEAFSEAISIFDEDTDPLNLGLAYRMRADSIRKRLMSEESTDVSSTAWKNAIKDIENDLATCEKIYITGNMRNTLSVVSLYLSYVKYYCYLASCNVEINESTEMRYAKRAMEIASRYSNGIDIIKSASTQEDVKETFVKVLAENSDLSRIFSNIITRTYELNI